MYHTPPSSAARRESSLSQAKGTPQSPHYKHTHSLVRSGRSPVNSPVNPRALPPESSTGRHVKGCDACLRVWQAARGHTHAYAVER